MTFFQGMIDRYGNRHEDVWCRCWWCHWEGVKEYQLAILNEVHPYIRMTLSHDTHWYCTWCLHLDEPTLRPNNRDRCHEWLLQAFPRSRIAHIHPPILRLIAEYLTDNVQGGDKILCGVTPDPQPDSDNSDVELYEFLDNLPPGVYLGRRN